MDKDHAKRLISDEVRRHISQAMVTTEPAMKRGHLEVAEALTLAVVSMETEHTRPRRWRRVFMKALKNY